MPNIKFGEIQEMLLPKEKPPKIFSIPRQYLFNSQDIFSLYILRSEIEKIEEHLDETPNVESGGLLIGHPFVSIDNPARVFTVIVGSLRVKSANSSIGHYTVTPEELSRVRSRIPEGLMSIGWYHSHPGHGVFLSGADMMIMESIYSLDWQIAFVFDTLKRNAGFFHGRKGRKVEDVYELDRKPACIEAVTRYNCAVSAENDGDGSVMESFIRWFRKNPMSEFSHWIQMGRYQDVQLGSIKFSSIPNSEWQKEFNKAVTYYDSGKILSAKLIFEHLSEAKQDEAVLNYLRKIKNQ